MGWTKVASKALEAEGHVPESINLEKCYVNLGTPLIKASKKWLDSHQDEVNKLRELREEIRKRFESELHAKRKTKKKDHAKDCPTCKTNEKRTVRSFWNWRHKSLGPRCCGKCAKSGGEKHSKNCNKAH